MGDLSGLSVFDISDPGIPDKLAVFSRPRGVHGMAAGEGYAFASDRWSLKVYNVTNLPAVKLVHQLRIPGVPRKIVVRENRLYLTADLKGFYIIDISEPNQPRILGTYEMTGFAYGLDVAGDFAFIANSDTGFHIIDIKDPSSPKPVGKLRTDGECYAVAVEEGCAYIADGDGGLKILDVSDPSSIKLIGVLETDGFINDVSIDGKFAYVSDENTGVIKIDISNPKTPRVVAAFKTPGECARVITAGELVIVADSFSLILLKK